MDEPFMRLKKRSANNLPATDREPVFNQPKIVQAIDQLNTQVAG